MATRHDGASALDLQRKDAEIARLRFELNASETAKVHAVELATLKHTAEIERLTAVHEERVKSVRLEYEARSGAAQEFQDDKAVLTKHAQSQSAAMEVRGSISWKKNVEVASHEILVQCRRLSFWCGSRVCRTSCATLTRQ
jgi:hypothetical protein